MSSNKGSKRKIKDQLPCRSKVIKMAGVPGSCSSVRDASSTSNKSSPVNSNNTTTSVRGDSVTSVVINTTGDTNMCPVCKQTTISISVEINSLRCCLCDTNFHGDCLSIDESLMNFLYVVVDVGGWCCTGCRKSNKVNSGSLNNNRVAPPPIPWNNASSAQSEVALIRNELEIIKSNITSLSNNILQLTHVNSMISHNSVDSKPTPKQNGKTYADVTHDSQSAVIPNSKLKTKASVLETFHKEINEIKKRESNVIVTGLQPRQGMSDDCLFQDLCATHLSVHPINVTVKRLGEVKPGKIQPLLVQLNNPGEASTLLSYARLLRQSSDPYVKGHVYLNKHMTKAQAAHAFNMLVQRRKAAAESGSKSTSQEQSQSDSGSGSGSGSGSNPGSSSVIWTRTVSIFLLNVETTAKQCRTLNDFRHHLTPLQVPRK